ncbi:TRAP transporter permease [Desulfospira joergensenii]|uniref:TRAP transporter permease n=1 Tax=Desulfospira joergensenii TaxID=53329 RepID=UPI001376FD8C|nr:TRAP transporter permease [Desulfospira joergensenii]
MDKDISRDNIKSGRIIMEESETGSRNIRGKIGQVISFIAIAMSLFQLYTGFAGELAGSKQLSVHLAFAMVLCFVYYPFRKKSPTDRIPISDLILALLGGGCAIYLYINYTHVVTSVGDAATYDILVGSCLILLVLEATRRSISPILPIICIIFLLYAYFGPYMPGELGHRGFRAKRIVDHIFMSGEGLWGVPLRVSATFVFLFVLFGAILDKIGAGQYLINLSFAMMGKYRGGPAKAAVVASCAMGSISGSSIANTVTTGAMTIPLMKKVGFKSHTAGAVEVAASTNGQLMPPIMGAAAFIMAEIIGVPYIEIVKAAFIPALLSYAAIFSIVHLEAVKENIRGLTKEETPPFLKTFLSGVHFLIPLAVLIWLLLVVRWTPTTAASWSILVGGATALGNNYLRSKKLFPLMEKTGSDSQDPAFLSYKTDSDYFFMGRTKQELLDSLETGARNMAGIAVACACCGIIVGVVTLTGLGLKMATLITEAAGGNLMLTLIFSVFACVILGMGLPTTATYIIMAAMTAPAIMTISSDLSLGLPIVAIHLFVFYYGIVADDTPPVGLCAYAAAGISGADPVKTGFKSFRLDLAAFTLPFMFIYNTKLLMINTSIRELCYMIPICLIGMFCWSIFIQGHWVTKTYFWERLVFLGLAFLLVNPGSLFIGDIEINHHLVNGTAIMIMFLIYLWQKARKEREEGGQPGMEGVV